MLVLSGAVASALLGCSRETADAVKLSASTIYTNNHYVPGAGYYHAPFHAWYPFPYNAYSGNRGYYYGGTWNAYPHEHSVAASQPSTYGVNKATADHQAHHGATRRGGFGSSSRSGVS